MAEVKRFGGVMNLDDKESDILPIQHIDAKNIRFYGGSNGLTAQNIKGNYLVDNSNLPADRDRQNDDRSSRCRTACTEVGYVRASFDPPISTPGLRSSRQAPTPIAFVDALPAA